MSPDDHIVGQLQSDTKLVVRKSVEPYGPAGRRRVRFLGGVREKGAGERKAPEKVGHRAKQAGRRADRWRKVRRRRVAIDDVRRAARRPKRQQRTRLEAVDHDLVQLDLWCIGSQVTGQRVVAVPHEKDAVLGLFLGR